MNRNDLWELLFAQAAGGVYGMIRGVAEFATYLAQAAWVLVVRALLAIIEWADGRWSDLEIADNPLWRMALAGGVGFLLATFLVLGITGAIGHWELGCLFGLTVGFCAFVGLMADPDKDWSLPKFPGRDRENGPGVSINL